MNSKDILKSRHNNYNCHHYLKIIVIILMYIIIYYFNLKYNNRNKK